MKKFILFLSTAALISACTDPKQAVVDDLRNETIALHDEVMPRMGEIVELAQALKQLREEVVLDSTDSTGSARLVYTEHIAALDAAHEDMMQWMADYEPDYEKEHPLDSALNYYEGQRVQILSVKQAIENSIEHANVLQQNHP